MTTTTERPRQRTLAQAEDRISELLSAGDPVQMKAQIITLTSQLAAKDAEIKALKTAGSSQQSAAAPATSQTPANPPAGERPLASLSKVEIADLMDEANAKGDKVLTDKLWREYCTRE
jgi:hypothetical protein